MIGPIGRQIADTPFETALLERMINLTDLLSPRDKVRPLLQLLRTTQRLTPREAARLMRGYDPTLMAEYLAEALGDLLSANGSVVSRALGPLGLNAWAQELIDEPDWKQEDFDSQQQDYLYIMFGLALVREAAGSQ